MEPTTKDLRKDIDTKAAILETATLGVFDAITGLNHLNELRRELLKTEEIEIRAARLPNTKTWKV